MTALSPRRWRASHLLGAWAAYWVVLLATWLARPALAAWRIKDAPPNAAQANVTFGDQGFVARIVLQGRTLVDLHASLGAVVFWLTVPPLVLFVVWLLAGPRPDQPRPAELEAGDPFDAVRDRAERDRAERDRAMRDRAERERVGREPRR